MNAICTLIDKLSTERHYAPCQATDEGTSAEATAQILVQWVFRYHGLPSSITSDRGPQFVATAWKSFCKRLGIKSKLSTAFHPETDGQTERANQDMEKQLRIYCNYMQDDWIKLLPMAEFADNNAVSAGTGMTPFFANKGFHPRMTFGPDDTKYETAQERVQAAKAEDITGTMDNILKLMRENAEKSQATMKRHADRHRREISYEVGDQVFLSSKNIITDRPSKKLEDKMLGPFPIVKKVGTSYELQLPQTMKVHNVFHSNLLRKDPGNPLPGQIQEPPGPIVTADNEEWQLADIVNSRWHYGRLQYRCVWVDEKARDLEWCYADGGEFENSADIVSDFHTRYPRKPGGQENLRASAQGRKGGPR